MKAPAGRERVAPGVQRLLAAARRAGSIAADLAAGIEAFALPQRCPSCGAPARPSQLLCEGCLALLPPLAIPLCARCLARGREPAGCLAHPGHAVWAAWVYDERVALLVHALKYQGRPGLAPALAVALERALPAGSRAGGAARHDFVTEVPLHEARRRERGYNQAAVLAESLADRLGVPRLPRVLERVRHTPPQARLGPAERRANLAGAFRVRQPARLAGRRVLVVDDVLTTGATLEGCLDALIGAGAEPAGVTLAWAQ
ncbi:MAG TPA: ComF family protein [Candidatus Eisenbacteria bacterium]